jgi:DNA-binding response OmpR family regulator
MDQARILVVDDDLEIAKAIEKLLTLEGYEVIKAFNGYEALDVIKNETIHLILLDVMMPKLDGLSTTLKVREQKNIPIIILSAKSEDSDKVLGLSMGADDYVTKPFSSQELLARVKSQLRRYLQLGDMGSINKETTLVNGGLKLDLDAMQLTVDGELVKMTAKELKILEFLMRNAGIVFSADKIYENVWNEAPYAVENTVMVHIRRIREKIEINPKEPNYLKVVWGIGYKIEKH